MKLTKDGVVCFLITMVPLNIIFTVRFLCEYLYVRDVWFWVSMSILSTLLIIGLIGCCLITKGDVKPSKHHTGEIYSVINIEDMTGEQYLTQYSLFILTAFAIPLKLAIVDVLLVLFVELTLLVVYVTNAMFYINPMLSLMQYKIFKVECKRVDSNNSEIMYVFAQNKSFVTKDNQLNIKHTDTNVVLFKKQTKKKEKV